MRIHRNAKTTPAARMTLVHRVLREDWTYAETAAAFAVSERTVAKWVRRFRAGGRAAVEDGSSRPGPAPHQTPARVVPRIRQLRVQQGLPAWAIARAVRRPRSTVSAWLWRLGISRALWACPRCPCANTSGPGPVTCSMSISSPGPGLARAAIGSMATGGACAVVAAGSMCLSLSMTTGGAPMSRSCPTNGATPARPFSTAVWRRWPPAP